MSCLIGCFVEYSSGIFLFAPFRFLSSGYRMCLVASADSFASLSIFRLSFGRFGFFRVVSLWSLVFTETYFSFLEIRDCCIVPYSFVVANPFLISFRFPFPFPFPLVVVVSGDTADPWPRLLAFPSFSHTLASPLFFASHLDPKPRSHFFLPFPFSSFHRIWYSWK